MTRLTTTSSPSDLASDVAVLFNRMDVKDNYGASVRASSWAPPSAGGFARVYFRSTSRSKRDLGYANIRGDRVELGPCKNRRRIAAALAEILGYEV
jgi:hypothetical protein